MWREDKGICSWVLVWPFSGMLGGLGSRGGLCARIWGEGGVVGGF